MLKILSLSALLIVVQAANIQDFYGDWLMVAFYPVSTYAPICIRFSISKNPENVQCVYADGSNATSVQVYMSTKSGTLMERHVVPMMVVNTPAEVMPALNITCKCDGKEIRDRGVLRLVNDNYFIMFQNIAPSMEYTRTELEKNSATLFAKNVVSEKELYDVMTSIEDLKGRRGAMLCVTENYGVHKSKENLVL